MATATILGELRSTWQIEQAALGVLREWLPSYMAEQERANGLELGTLPRPAGDDFYYGGLDFQSEVPGDLPVVIVTVKPNGDPEVSSRFYTQQYDLKVGCIVAADSEEEARRNVSLMGAATMLLAEVSSLQGLAERTRMTGATDPEWVTDEVSQRRLMRAVTSFSTWVTAIVPQTGPEGTLADTLEMDPQAPELLPTPEPQVEHPNVTITVT